MPTTSSTWYSRAGRADGRRQTRHAAEGQAAFVPAGADHRFTGYEGLSVLVISGAARATCVPPPELLVPGDRVRDVRLLERGDLVLGQP